MDDPEGIARLQHPSSERLCASIPSSRAICVIPGPVGAAGGGVLRDLQAKCAGEALAGPAPRRRGELRAESHSCPIVHTGLLPAEDDDRSRGRRQDGDRRGGTIRRPSLTPSASRALRPAGAPGRPLLFGGVAFKYQRPVASLRPRRASPRVTWTSSPRADRERATQPISTSSGGCGARSRGRRSPLPAGSRQRTSATTCRSSTASSSPPASSVRPRSSIRPR